jgi:hypothetical protein
LFSNYFALLDIESTALVERMLNELIKATEAYQIAKNESAVHANEANLNTQAIVPLQKENERLVKENNQLHRDLI